MPIESWFPEFVFFEDVELPEEVKWDAIAAIEERIDPKVMEQQTLITANGTRNDFHLEPRIERLLMHLLPVFDRCFFEELKIDRNKVQFTVGRCWPVVQINNGSSGAKHRHWGSTFSAVMYLEVPDGAGSLEFLKEGRSLYDGLPMANYSPITYQTAKYDAKEGRILIFPSELEHRRLRNEGEGEGRRLAIALDIYSSTDIEHHESGRPHESDHIKLDLSKS